MQQIINSEIHREYEIYGKQPGEQLKISLDNSIAENYNKEYKKMQDELKETYKNDETEFSNKLSSFFILRLACCALAYFNYFYTVILLSLLQFLILPFSFVIALNIFVQIFFSIFFGFYAFYPLATYAFRSLFNADSWMNASLEINETFIFCFFLIDFAICLSLSFSSQMGKTKRFALKRMLQSITYGFLNTKTYHLLILLLIRGAKIHIFLWLIDIVLNITEKLNNYAQEFCKINFPIIFYHQHRVAHLPHVYPDAHKFHHFLHDSSPFDAHLYGFGAPEEWHCFVFETLPSMFLGVFPPSLCFSALKISLNNKLGHTRKENGNDQETVHVDHHLHHVKNFSWNITLEMFMGTCVNNAKMVCYGYTVSKELVDGKAVFTYERN